MTPYNFLSIRVPNDLWVLLINWKRTFVFNLWLIFPLATGYALVRRRRSQTLHFLNQVFIYALLVGAAMLGYVLLVAGASLLVGQAVPPSNPWLVGLMVLILAACLNPFYNYLQGSVDRLFYRRQPISPERRQQIGRLLSEATGLAEITDLLRKEVDTALSPAALHIYLYDPLSNQYVAATGEKDHSTSDICFSETSVLVQALSTQPKTLVLRDLDHVPTSLQPEQARLMILAALVYLPLMGRSRLFGWLALGERKSGHRYSSLDLHTLESLCDQVILAIERVQVVMDLERHVREQEVLARVAQGMSFTVALDDLFELMTAQTNFIFPVRDFRITLLDDETQVLSHAFFLEDDERLPEREKQPIPPGHGLEREVINTQLSLVTENYELECRRRGIQSDMSGIFAWMGVPLNNGARTIGSVVVGSRDPSTVYNQEQRDLFQAIADQAAGAITKARSLEETQQRARQLAKLNEISLSLTSTLETKPLLRRILDSATQILACQAGALFLVDPQTEELVFDDVNGPLPEELVGTRLPKDTGLAGESLITGQPILANEAALVQKWLQSAPSVPDFVARNMLVVPMRIQEKVIGVIEVINKSNGVPFTQSDQDLIMAFASQASIAMENARLYTMTDQALAARVEELSVMQRIDHELNASLDIQRAMRITLDWAMLQSHAEAGLIGAPTSKGVLVMASEGYHEVLSPSDEKDGEETLIHLDLPVLNEAMKSGLPQSVLFDCDGDRTSAILQDATAQIVIPIRREEDTIGVLLLETRHREPPLDEKLNFLTRLSEHAAIAISNGQLYEEVNTANLAKSQFVSFVAHELKNPMASIKGYTELVLAGMAGPVNEMQTGFLSTVRSNVDRMNNIVTDLNDLTKIQVGVLRLNQRHVSLRDSFDDVTRSLTRQFQEKNQQLDLQIPDDLPDVWADPSRLAQIITNLLSNAQKYTPADGKISMGAERYEDKDSELDELKLVQIWVKDTGIGITDEDKPKIFEQYFRTDQSKEMTSGTGLGLSITRSLVMMQGGKIWFESQPGQGTTFHFTVPVAESQ